MKAKRILILGALATVLAIVTFTWWLRRPNVTIHGFERDSDVRSVALLPLSDSQRTDIAARIADARRDRAASRKLLDLLISDSWPRPLIATRTSGDTFTCRSPDGPALAYHLDKEGYAYFAFAEIHGFTTIRLEREENGIYLTRLAENK
jgi:hypothetical protein